VKAEKINEVEEVLLERLNREAIDAENSLNSDRFLIKTRNVTFEKHTLYLCDSDNPWSAILDSGEKYRINLYGDLHKKLNIAEKEFFEKSRNKKEQKEEQQFLNALKKNEQIKEPERSLEHQTFKKGDCFEIKGAIWMLICTTTNCVGELRWMLILIHTGVKKSLEIAKSYGFGKSMNNRDYWEISYDDILEITKNSAHFK